MLNQGRLTASVLEIKPLRYTPAGVPVTEMVLAHESSVMEAGAQRHVQLSIAAVALGDVGLLAAQTPLGVLLNIEGFLAPVRKGAGKLVLHIQHVSRVYPDAGAVTV